VASSTSSRRSFPRRSLAVCARHCGSLLPPPSPSRNTGSRRARTGSGRRGGSACRVVRLVDLDHDARGRRVERVRIAGRARVARHDGVELVVGVADEDEAVRAVVGWKAIESSPPSPPSPTSPLMSRKGVGSSAPFCSTRIEPGRDTTNRRASPAFAMWIGWSTASVTSSSSGDCAEARRVARRRSAGTSERVRAFTRPGYRSVGWAVASLDAARAAAGPPGPPRSAARRTARARPPCSR